MILILLLVLGCFLFAFAGVAFVMEVYIRGSADQSYLDSFERIPGKRARDFWSELSAKS